MKKRFDGCEKTDVLMYVYNEYNHKTNTEIAEYFLRFRIISVLFDENSTVYIKSSNCQATD